MIMPSVLNLDISWQVRIAMSYQVTRRDVYNYVVDSDSWQPAWLPEPFVPVNAQDIAECSAIMQPPKLATVSTDAPFQKLEARLNGKMHAIVTFVYRGTFEETFELYNFPFDVQVCPPNTVWDVWIYITRTSEALFSSF
eukprot:SAG31_NODE_2591_length_5425_cov_4.004694_6_plen_138_part_01